MSWLVRWITSCFLPDINDEHKITSSPRVIVGNATFDKRKNKHFNSIIKNNLSQPSKRYNKKHLIEEPRTQNLSCSFFREEDFIVFCFDENGAYDVVKDDKGVHTYAKPFILKGKEKEDKDKYKINSRRVCHVEGIEDYEMRMSFESRASIQSEDSTGSFAFPVLDLEWIGSPTQMPKSEGQQQLKIKKQKAKFLRFQGCRF